MNIVTRTQGVTKGLAYPFASFAMPEVGIPHYLVPLMENVMLETYPSPYSSMPSGGVYTCPYIPPSVVPNSLVAQVEINTETIFTQALPVQSSEELKE